MIVILLYKELMNVRCVKYEREHFSWVDACVYNLFDILSRSYLFLCKIHYYSFIFFGRSGSSKVRVYRKLGRWASTTVMVCRKLRRWAKTRMRVPESMVDGPAQDWGCAGNFGGRKTQKWGSARMFVCGRTWKWVYEISQLSVWTQDCGCAERQLRRETS